MSFFTSNNSQSNLGKRSQLVEELDSSDKQHLACDSIQTRVARVNKLLFGNTLKREPAMKERLILRSKDVAENPVSCCNPSL